MRDCAPAKRTWFLPIASAVVLSALLAACGAVTPVGSGSPSPASSPVAGLTVARDSDNGKTLNLHVGDRLEVQLGSTYWTVNGSTNGAVLQTIGQAVVSPQPTGCVPGAGCGFVTALFDAVAPGNAAVTASRNSCGEAMGCTGDQGLYRVSVVVTS